MSQKYSLIQPQARKWKPHPQFAGVEISHLITKEKDGIDVTCALVRLPVGSDGIKHVHETSDDIIYVLQGKAVMWIDGTGEVPLTAGTFLRIPKGVLHQPRGIEEDLLLYDVWFPAVV